MLGTLVALNFATATLGLPIVGEEGKFSISNIAPLLFCAVATPLFLASRERMDRRVVWFFIAYNGTSLLSFVIFLIRFRWEPNFFVLAFQDVELLFCLLLAWYARDHYAEMRSAIRAGIYASFLVLAYYGVKDFSDRSLQWSFGMDDKSHTAVLFCCEAYILIRFMGKKLDYVVALVLVTLAMLTISREPFLLLPSILLALSVRSRWGVALTAVVGAGVAAAVYLAGTELLDIFTVFDRLTSVGRVTGEDSTVVHVLLIRSALELKFSDFGCFLFGIGPGNFSKALTTFQVLLPQIQAVDPVLASAAQDGRAPMHSVPASLLLDMNLLFFLACVFLALKALRYLLRTRSIVDTVFVTSLLAASTFYSLHNKPYFFLVVTSLVVLIRGEWEGWPQRRTGTAWAQPRVQGSPG